MTVSTILPLVGVIVATALSIVSAAQGIKSRAVAEAAQGVAEAAESRAEQNAAQVVELQRLLLFEREERQRERKACAEELATLQTQLTSAMATWATHLAPTLAAELKPLITTIMREART